MLVLHDPQTGLIEQFFFGLEDTNLADYEWRTQSMQAILGIEGANLRQVLKQPDVLMLLYLLARLLCRHCKRTGTTTPLDHTYGSRWVQLSSYPGLPLRQDRRGG